MLYEEMVKKAYEEIVGGIDKEAAGMQLSPALDGEGFARKINAMINKGRDLNIKPVQNKAPKLSPALDGEGFAKKINAMISRGK